MQESVKVCSDLIFFKLERIWDQAKLYFLWLIKSLSKFLKSSLAHP